MDSWEFLLQKEGSRTWQPLKSSKIAIEAGRYRVVAHSSCSNTEVEICVSHENTEEFPPKRRSQKRSRRTNREGLMVVIPFTYLKPGKWELRCSGDIMSDFLGKSWQETLQLQVLPTAALSSPVVESTQITETDGKVASEIAPRKTEVVVQSAVSDEQDSELEIAVKDSKNGTVPESEKLQPNPELNQVKLEENQSKLTPDSANFASQQDWEPEVKNGEEISSVPLSVKAQTVTNPILEESLEMLDQILQQVLDPLWQDLEPSEASELHREETPEFNLPLESSGLTLALEDDALVAKGKSFSITGFVDVLGVHELNGSQNYHTGDLVFQGSLQYELRDPQNSKVLLNIQHPLPEQPLPLAFSQTIEIPSDCNTRVILGKVTLYSSKFVALASQSFSVTADLNELLRSILPGTKVMPVAKMLVVSQESPVSPEVPAISSVAIEPEAETVAVNQVVLDLINTRPSSQPRPLQAVSQQPLPPQIYQPSPTQKPSKSLQLPNFPRMQPPTAAVEEQAVEGKEEDSVEQLVALAKELFPETARPLAVVATKEEARTDVQNQEILPQSQETKAEAEAVSEDNFSAIAWDDALGDSSLVSLEHRDRVETPLLTEDSVAKVETSADSLETPLLTEDSAAKVETSADSLAMVSEVSDSPQVEKLEDGDNPVVLDNAFPALNIQNRFWLRLNSLASDEQFSQWLKSDVSASGNLVEGEEVTPPLTVPTLSRDEVRRSFNSDTLLAEAEEVTQELNSDTLFTNFDNALWEEAEDLVSEFVDEHQLQLPVLEEETPPEVAETPQETPEQQEEVVTQQDWDAQEFVVEDEEVISPEPTFKRRETLGKVDAWEIAYPTKEFVSKSKPVILPPPQLESPIPAPIIVLATNELTAGEMLTVRVKLPPNRARLCVKLWLQDRQSRYLLDGPRWLVDLLPDGTGKLEAMTQLVVPFGSVDIRFEAISVDLDSQRESHKVAVDCVVIPSDLVKLGLDEFDA